MPLPSSALLLIALLHLGGGAALAQIPQQAAAAARFAGDGIRVLGTVLNAWDPETNGSGYYEGYSHDERYYAGGRAEAAHGSA